MKFEEIHEVIETLNHILINYQEGTTEHKAIKCAITAVCALFDENVRQRFIEWRENRDLTDKQRKHLEDMGINPDTGELEK